MSQIKRRISEVHSSSKRAKRIDEDLDEASRESSQFFEYSNGSICEIDLINFMTHEKFKWKPGARVNLISGPNGAGKSSILQAIVLALGKQYPGDLDPDLEFLQFSIFQAQELQTLRELPNLVKVLNTERKKPLSG